jgi:hypothetical protein
MSKKSVEFNNINLSSMIMLLMSQTMRRRNGGLLVATSIWVLFLLIAADGEPTRRLTKRQSDKEFEWIDKLDEYVEREYFGRTADENPQKKQKNDSEMKVDIPSTIPFGYSGGNHDENDNYGSSSSAKGSKGMKGSKSGGSKGSKGKGKGKGNVFDRYPTPGPTFPYTTSPNFLNPETIAPSSGGTVSPSMLNPDTEAPSPLYTTSPSLLNPKTPAPSPVYTASPSLLNPPTAIPGVTASPTNSSSTNSPSFTNTSVPDTISPNATQAPASSVSPTKVPSSGTLSPAPPSTNAPGTAPTTTAPAATLSPDTVAPAPTGTTNAPAPSNAVKIRQYFIAYEAPLSTQEPTDDEYQTITQLTTAYFDEIFTAQYSGNSNTVFDAVQTILDSTKYQAGIPTENFNIYMAFNSSVVFKAGSSLPTEPELFDIMQASIGTTYIVNWVWQASDTQFISTQAVIMDEVAVPGNSTAMSSKTSAYNFGQLEGKFVLPKSKITTDIFREEAYTRK